MIEPTIIKIGTHTLLGKEGDIRHEVIESVLSSIKKRMNEGERFLLVTSGAVAFGRHLIKDEIINRHVAGAVGQPYIFGAYERSARKFDIRIAELLLSRPHIVERSQFLQLQQTVESMFEHNVLPIVNEHDALVTDSDWSFGDNDSLAAALAVAFRAKKLIILSHVNGVFEADPDTDKSAKLIPEIVNVNNELMKCCSAKSSTQGRGGMVSKLKAARLCTNIGIETIITGNLDSLEPGTRCIARKVDKTISNRDRWILAAKSSAASIQVDDGAAKALTNGKSLLAVGIKKIIGSFNQGEIVEIVSMVNDGLAFGLTDVDSTTLTKTDFKNQKGVQVMHADNIMVF